MADNYMLVVKILHAFWIVQVFGAIVRMSSIMV